MDVEVIKIMIEEGFSIHKIAYLLNLERKDVKKIVMEENFILQKEEFAEDKITKICELYEKGVSAKQLGKKFSIDKRRVLRWAKERNILRSVNDSRRTIIFNYHIFDEIDTPEKAYWLGFLYADGYNYGNSKVSISLQSRDYDHLVKLAKFVEMPENRIFYTKTEEGYEHHTLSMHSMHLSLQLTKLGCPQAKSFIITYPEWLPAHLDVHFIRGIFDGDGCLYCNKSNMEWKWNIASTEMCCVAIQNILLKYIGIQVFCHNISETGHNTSLIETRGNEKVTKIMNWLYSEGSTFLDRKRTKFESLLEQQANRRFSRNQYKLDEFTKQVIKEEMALGISYFEIAKRHGVHPRTVSKLKYQ